MSTDEQARDRHGSPLFYSLLSEMADTHDKKSHDYASNSNPFGNYHFAGHLALLFAHSSEDAGFAGRLGEKMYRLANLERDGKTPRNESIEDTERDFAVIATLWMADRRQRRWDSINAKQREQLQKQDKAQAQQFAEMQRYAEITPTDELMRLIAIFRTVIAGRDAKQAETVGLSERRESQGPQYKSEQSEGRPR